MASVTELSRNGYPPRPWNPTSGTLPPTAHMTLGKFLHFSKNLFFTYKMTLVIVPFSQT